MRIWPWLLPCTCLLIPLLAQAAPSKIDGLYVNTFGKPKNPAIVYIHGGPGYNSFDFESSTAAQLADAGYFVVAYDERGAGRSDSAKSNSEFTYEAYVRDLKAVIDRLKINKPVLMGHSFGGSVALRFMDAYPGVSNGAILVAAPASFPQTFRAIVKRATTANLRLTLDPLEYRRHVINLAQIQFVATAFFCPFPIYGVHQNGRRCIPPEVIGLAFTHAISTGVFQTASPSIEEVEIAWSMARKDDSHLLNEVRLEPLIGFAATENYATLDLFDSLHRHRDQIFGIYGQDDGLFDSAQLGQIENTLPEGHFRMISNASHAVFQHQRMAFIDQVKNDMRELDRSCERILVE